MSGDPAGADPSAIGEALGAVRARVEAAARRAGRDPAAVTLVGATKTVPAERVLEAVRAGLTDVGENRAQELLAKAPHVAAAAPELRWHFLGPLQRNKVKALAPWVWCWQSVDRAALGAELARRAQKARVLVEVNVAGEPTKAGCAPGEASALVDRLAELGLDVIGVMAVPPAGEDPRPWFEQLRALRDDLGLAELSMGMTDDYEVAVEEGATIVRVGRAIFGARSSA